MTLQSLTARRLSRRMLIRSTSLGIGGAAGVTVLSQLARSAGIAQPLVNAALASPVATPSPADGFAQTPFGEQLAWFLAAVNGGGTALTEGDVTAHFAPTFLAVVPPAVVIGLIQSLAAGYGSLTLEGVTRPPTATQAIALVITTAGLPLAMPITVEDASPHRITGLTVHPVPSATGEPLLPLPSTDTGSAAITPLVEIGGRRLYASDMGTGEPTVVLEAGLDHSAAVWAGIIPAIAAITRVVSYDRPNTLASASDPAPTPRTGADIVTDLHALLSISAIPGPYVLVGHSVGGLFARLYASHYPDQVAGMVLIDASHEAQDQRRQDLVSADLFAAEQRAIGANSEGIDVDASFSEMAVARTATPLRSMPLIVLSAGQADPAMFPAGWPMEAEAMLHTELQADLAQLVPGGRLVVAAESGHSIHQSQPDLVVEAIRQVVEAVRDPSTWATPTASPVAAVGA